MSQSTTAPTHHAALESALAEIRDIVGVAGADNLGAPKGVIRGVEDGGEQ